MSKLIGKVFNPSITFQVGLTSRDQYIHRLGRTARAGKGGSGVLLCFPDEALVLRKELSDMPLQQCEVTEFNSSPMEEGGKPLLDLPARWVRVWMESGVVCEVA